MKNKDGKLICLPNQKGGKFSWFPRENDGKSILPNGKKAAEMTIGTIIIIILALIVLAVIVYGFSTGWGNLWENIKNFGGGKTNLGTVVKSCQVYCTSLSIVDYCAKTEVRFNDANGKLITAKVNCDEIKKGITVTDTKNPALSATIPAAGLECDLECPAAPVPTPTPTP